MQQGHNPTSRDLCVHAPQPDTSRSNLQNGLDLAFADHHVAADQPHSARNRCTEPTRLDSGAGKVENGWDVAGLDNSVVPSSQPP